MSTETIYQAIYVHVRGETQARNGQRVTPRSCSPTCVVPGLPYPF